MVARDPRPPRRHPVRRAGTPGGVEVGGPPWLAVARRLLDEGIREVPGSDAHPRILAMFAAIGAADYALDRGDETAWCGAAVSYVLQQAEQWIPGPPSCLRAGLFETYGQPLDIVRAGHASVRGAVVVLTRPIGDYPRAGRHVGLTDGMIGKRLAVIGGNQRNGFVRLPYDLGRVVALRWPPGFALPEAR